MRRLACSLAFFVFALAGTAHAHAIVLTASPAQHAKVSGPDVSVNLRFNSRIDGKRSVLILVTPEGEQRKLAVTNTGAEDRLVSEAKGLKSGAYVLRWQVLASDGHISRGEVSFSVE
jgi:methionine-rich copper-binding protein CopC